jgi:hypothetical protein
MVVGLAVAALWCTTSSRATDDEAGTAPIISAERLGDADAPEPGPEVEVEEEHYLSPAEREALAAQGYELEIDDTIVTQTRIQPSKAEKEKPKGPWERRMDTVGRGMVAVASVVVPLAAAVAPFFLF